MINKEGKVVKFSDYMGKEDVGQHCKIAESRKGKRELNNLAWDMNDNVTGANDTVGCRRNGRGNSIVDS